MATERSPDGSGEFGVLVIETPAVLQGRRLPLPAPEVVLGRHGAAAVDSATVSRRHARLWAAAGQVHIVDLGSANGTIVNGEPVTGPRPLLDGDRIRLGDVEAVFHRVPESQRRNHPGPAPQPARSEPTRYLCAATHLDHRYRERVLDATVREQHRAVCPSHGIDLAVIARHAILAHRRALQRDLALTALLVAVLVSGGAVASNGVLRAVLLLGGVVLVVGWAVVVAETWARFSTLGTHLRPGGRPDLVRVQAGAGVMRLLDVLAAANEGNVVVYSDYQPFVGSGVQVDRSSYPVPLLPRADEGETAGRRPASFSAGELVRVIASGLVSLRLDGLRVDRRLFVGGYDIAQFAELLPDPRHRPVVFAPGRLLDEVIERPSGTVRPYLCAQMTGWHGQLVVTTFVRVVLLTGLLFVETATYVLAPLRPEYLAVDAMRIRTRRERVVATLAHATTHLLPAIVAAPFRLLSALGARNVDKQREREFVRRLQERIRIDRGATSSIREEASRDGFDRYFAQLDAEMAISVVREKVADAIAEFLDARGYRTDKINLIQNNMTVNDNSFRMENVQGNFAGVGNRAQARISNGGQSNMNRGGAR